MSFQTGSGTSRQSNELDPFTLAVNQARSQQLQGLIGATGGLSQLTGRPDLATPGAGEQAILNRFAGLPGQPLARGPETEALSTLRGLQQPQTSPFDIAGLRTFQQLGDPQRFNQALGQSQDIFRSITTPSVINAMTAAGLGRSGAVAESLARAGAEMSLPLSQQLLGQQFDAGRMFGEGALGLGSRQAQERFGAGMGLAQAGLNLGPTLENRELDRLQTALSAAALPREAMFQEMVMRPEANLMALLTGMPILTTPLSSRVRSRQTQWGVDLGQIIGAAGMMAGCWIADALYGNDDRAMFARLGVMEWPLWAQRLYRRFGRRLSRSRRAVRLLAPVFARAAARGRQRWLEMA